MKTKTSFAIVLVAVAYLTAFLTMLPAAKTEIIAITDGIVGVSGFLLLLKIAWEADSVLEKAGE
jgi:hypothetical protein